MNKVIIASSEEETQKVGEDLASNLKGKNIIALYGDLGSGKTTFVQGLAKGLGISRRISSPTFIIVRTYRLKSQSSKLKTTAQNSKLFYHIDLYRIENSSQIKGLGIEEIIKDPQNIVAVEWAEKIESILPEKRINIYFEYLSENERKITITEVSF